MQRPSPRTSGFTLFAFAAIVAFTATRRTSGSLEAASTSVPWSWEGSRFMQPVRCEGGVFNVFPGTPERWTLEGPFRNYAADRKLKFLEFNMLNLFERDLSISGAATGKKGNRGPKPQQQREAAARILRAADADVMVLVEVENKSAVAMYDRAFLKDRYVELLIDGNDARGIDIAVLVKRDLPFDIEYRTMKDLTDVASKDPVFSRDLPIGIFRRQDLPDRPVEFIILGTHYKSKRGDGESTDLRRAQAEATALTLRALRAEFGADVPVFLTGDFNNSLHEAPEFASLWKEGFRDALDLSPDAPPREKRGTHFYFPPHGPRENHQIDGFLVSAPDTLKVRNARILPHLDDEGRPLPAPKTYKERESRASDHLATELEIYF